MTSLQVLESIPSPFFEPLDPANFDPGPLNVRVWKMNSVGAFRANRSEDLSAWRRAEVWGCGVADAPEIAARLTQNVPISRGTRQCSKQGFVLFLRDKLKGEPRREAVQPKLMV